MRKTLTHKTFFYCNFCEIKDAMVCGTGKCMFSRVTVVGNYVHQIYNIPLSEVKTEIVNPWEQKNRRNKENKIRQPRKPKSSFEPVKIESWSVANSEQKETKTRVSPLVEYIYQISINKTKISSEEYSVNQVNPKTLKSI